MFSNNDLRRLAKSTSTQNRALAAINPRIANLNGGQLLRNLVNNNQNASRCLQLHMHHAKINHIINK